MENSQFLISKTDNAKDFDLPKYMTKGSVGMDLCANVEDDIILKHGEIKKVPTGIKISIPEGYEAQIRPRSGLALNHGITMLNAPGTIDSDYRGEICAILINFGGEDFSIKRGERIAQMVINKVEVINFVEVLELDETNRGSGGFGHTGK